MGYYSGKLMGMQAEAVSGIVTDGLIQHIVLSDYTSGSVVPARVGANGTNYNAVKQVDGSLKCKRNEYFTLNNTLYGKTIEIVAKSANINNTSYFTLLINGSSIEDFTLVRTSNLLQRHPPLVSCGLGIWSTIHNTACFLQNNTNTSQVKVFQNASLLNSGTTNQGFVGQNIFVGTRDIASNYIYVYEIRLYDRELTLSELAQNYNVDKLKYGL